MDNTQATKPTYEELEAKANNLESTLYDMVNRYNKLYKLYSATVQAFLTPDKNKDN